MGLEMGGAQGLQAWRESESGEGAWSGGSLTKTRATGTAELGMRERRDSGCQPDFRLGDSTRGLPGWAALGQEHSGE